jgi:TusE/DsrC/DsvC family sulfur relay protein
MTTREIANATVEVDDDGFFVDPTQWTEDMAPLLAEECGVPTPLTDKHWQVLHFMRDEFFEKGTGPTVRKLGKTSGVTVKELYKLFPKGPAKLAARCAGIPKPRGCV